MPDTACLLQWQSLKKLGRGANIKLFYSIHDFIIIVIKRAQEPWQTIYSNLTPEPLVLSLCLA